MAKTHAEILADIAAEVAAGYRNTLVPIPGELGVIEPTNVPVPGDTIRTLNESLSRADQAIASLEQSGAFRYDGLTLEQWEQARVSYIEQILNTEEAFNAEWLRIHQEEMHDPSWDYVLPDRYQG